MFGMVACAPEPSEQTEQPTQTLAISPELHEITPSPSPTSTPSITKAILVTSDEADPIAIAQSQDQIASLAKDAGLAFEIVENLTAEMLTPNVQIVVGVGSGANLVDLAARNPGIVFLFLDQMEVLLSDNISQIGDPIQDKQHQAFMAGYLAALISSDYKIAALVPSDHDERDLILDSFVTGARFFCGNCQPKYPPYNSFPQWETIPSEDANQGFEGTVDALISQGVEVLYVSDDLASATLLAYLTEAGIKVVGDNQPEEMFSNWAGTVYVDYGGALVALWPQLLDGVGGVRLAAPITLRDRNPNLVSEGRFRLFEEIAADLEAGLIAPGSQP